MSQIVSLSENELDLLASFMGHDIRVHREYYRLPEESMQVAKVTKLLLAVESGEMACLKDQDLKNVDVTDWLECQ